MSTVELANATGLTFRVVDYWARLGTLPLEIDADGSGSRRYFADDALRVCQRRVRVRNYLGEACSNRHLSPASLDKVADLLETIDDLSTGDFKP